MAQRKLTAIRPSTCEDRQQRVSQPFVLIPVAEHGGIGIYRQAWLAPTLHGDPVDEAVMQTDPYQACL